MYVSSPAKVQEEDEEVWQLHLFIYVIDVHFEIQVNHLPTQGKGMKLNAIWNIKKGKKLCFVWNPFTVSNCLAFALNEVPNGTIANNNQS